MKSGMIFHQVCRSFPVACIDKISIELVNLLQSILRKDPHNRFSLQEIKEHPWFHVNGRMDIPSIPPKISGKVDASKLGQIVKSINSDKEFQVYTFNYHDQQKSSTSKAVEHTRQEQTRQRSNSAVVARRKSISIMAGGQRPDFGVVVNPNQISAVTDSRSSVASVQGPNAAPSVSMLSDSRDEDIEARARSRRPTVTERPSFLAVASPTVIGVTYASNGGLEKTDSSGPPPPSASGKIANNTGGFKMEGLGAANKFLPRAGSDVGRHRGRAATVSTSRSPSPLSPAVSGAVALEPTLLEESPDQPTTMNFIGRRKSFRNDIQEQKSQDNTSVSPESSRASSVANNAASPEKSLVNSLKVEVSESDLMRRLSMVSKPADQTSDTFAEDSLIANLGLNSLPMDEIAEWHAIHRPPKEIRIVKFNFRKGTSSAVIDPATMFQDVHRVLLSLPEFKNKSLSFKRHPDYYDFTCIFKEDNIEIVKFDIEVCKVWLLDVHAVKIKRRQGDAYQFKLFYDKIVGGLNWIK